MYSHAAARRLPSGGPEARQRAIIRVSSMDFYYFLEIFFSGLTRGSIYALIALGYTMVYGIIGLINFAHGEIYMLGAFTALIVATMLGMAGFPAGGILIVAALVAMIWCAAYGFTMEKVAYKPLRGESRLAPLISAIGMSTFLQNYVQLAQTSNYVPFPRLMPRFDFLSAFGGVMRSSDFVILVVSALVMIGLALYIRYTRMGKAIQATSMDRYAAGLVGINPDRSYTIAFAIASAVAGAAGCALTYYYYMFPNVGATFQLWGFIAVAMGGFGSVTGAFLSGLVMGLADTLTGLYVNTAIKYIGVCVVFLVTVSFRPKGIFGK